MNDLHQEILHLLQIGEEKGFTRSKMAALLTVSPPTITRWMRGEVQISQPEKVLEVLKKEIQKSRGTSKINININTLFLKQGFDLAFAKVGIACESLFCMLHIDEEGDMVGLKYYQDISRHPGKHLSSEVFWSEALRSDCFTKKDPRRTDAHIFGDLKGEILSDLPANYFKYRWCFPSNIEYIAHCGIVLDLEKAFLTRSHHEIKAQFGGTRLSIPCRKMEMILSLPQEPKSPLLAFEAAYDEELLFKLERRYPQISSSEIYQMLAPWGRTGQDEFNLVQPQEELEKLPESAKKIRVKNLALTEAIMRNSYRVKYTWYNCFQNLSYFVAWALD